MTTEETVEVKFLHHYTDRRDRSKPVAHVPGSKETFPVSVARGLVASHVAEYATKKAERAAADAATV